MPISPSDIAHLKKSYKFLNKRRYAYLEFQYLAIEKNSSKLKKKKFFSIDSTNQTFIMYKNSCEQNLSDDVTQSYVIKMYVRKTNIGLIWVKGMYRNIVELVVPFSNISIFQYFK